VELGGRDFRIKTTPMTVNWWEERDSDPYPEVPENSNNVSPSPSKNVSPSPSPSPDDGEANDANENSTTSDDLPPPEAVGPQQQREETDSESYLENSENVSPIATQSDNDTNSIEFVLPVVETDIETTSVEVLEVVSPAVDLSILPVVPPVVMLADIDDQPSAPIIPGFTPLSPGDTDAGNKKVLVAVQHSPG
jgi:hypothetical protein